MNKKELQELLRKNGLTDDKVIDAISDEVIVQHGKDIESIKTANTTMTAENGTLKTQLTDANTQIAKFKGMKVEDIQKAADDWKTKAETTKVESDKQIAALRFDHALESELTIAHAKNPKAVRALLKVENLRLGEDGKIIGLEDQLKPLQEKENYLFDIPETDENGKQLPKIVSKTGGGKTISQSSLEAAAMRGANLKEDQS